MKHRTKVRIQQERIRVNSTIALNANSVYGEGLSSYRPKGKVLQRCDNGQTWDETECGDKSNDAKHISDTRYIYIYIYIYIFMYNGFARYKKKGNWS